MNGRALGPEHVVVLPADGGDEVVHAQHLEHRQTRHQNEPGGHHLLDGSFAVEGSPDTRGLQGGCLVLVTTGALLSVTKELVEFCKLGLAVFAAASTQARDLVVAEIIIRRMNLDGISEETQGRTTGQPTSS